MSLAQGIRISCANYLPIGVESINSNLAVISPEKVAGSRKVFSSAGKIYQEQNFSVGLRATGVFV